MQSMKTWRSSLSPSEHLVERPRTGQLTLQPAKGAGKETTSPMEDKKQLKFTWKASFSSDLIWSLEEALSNSSGPWR